MTRVILALVLCLAVSAVALRVENVPAMTSGEMTAIRASTTGDKNVVLGLSAGAFAAEQFHMIHTSTLVGAVIVAGGPFYCAQDSQVNALTACMSVPSELNAQTFVDAYKACAKGGACDPIEDLQKQRVYLWSGTGDTVVHQQVMKTLYEQLTDLMPAANVNTTFTVPAEHSWPTNNYGNSCGTLGSPYINNCGIDVAYESMSWVLNGNVKAPVTGNASAISTISQASYTPDSRTPAAISMGPDAYVYTPLACKTGAANCSVAIALHGCQQTVDDIGLDFVGHIGLNEVAEANNYVVLYPQAIKSYFAPSNPEGCFDWWGYTDSNYSNRKGLQMQTIMNMAKALSGTF